jgi:hypothetical protein
VASVARFGPHAEVAGSPRTIWRIQSEMQQGFGDLEHRAMVCHVTESQSVCSTYLKMHKIFVLNQVNSHNWAEPSDWPSILRLLENAYTCCMKRN